MKKLLLLILCTPLFFACTPHTSNTPQKERPHSPWVFRSVLDTQARMITLALDDKMWVAYHTSTGALYKAWSGGVILQGAVYNTLHGPQPVSYGDAWMENQFEHPWVLAEGTTTTPLNVRYKGHRFQEGKVQLLYELSGEEGIKIQVSEQVEHFSSGTHREGLERIFTVEGLPSNKQLALLLNANSIAKLEDITTDGTFEYAQHRPIQLNSAVKGLEVTGMLLLNSVQKTRLAITFIGTPFIPNPVKLEGEEDLPLGAKIIAQNDCKTCHNPIQRTVGPSYKEIAKRYPNTPENTSYLVEKIKNGGAGVWGQTPMTPHPEVADKDIAEMVAYIMEMDADEEVKTSKTADLDMGEMVHQKGATLADSDLLPGVKMTFWKDAKGISSVSEIDETATPLFETIISDIRIKDTDFTWIEANYMITYEGYLDVPEDEVYTFRLTSDDGSRLFINQKAVIDNDGFHGMDAVDGQIALRAGKHAFKVLFFQGLGGKGLRLQWRNRQMDKFERVPTSAYLHHKVQQKPNDRYPPPASLHAPEIPGDGYQLEGLHPNYELSQARPNDFAPKVAGMDFLSDGRLVISTWDAIGGVYVLDNVANGNPEQITVKRIAEGLAEPLGLKVVNDEIYVLQKQELTQLIDHDEDDYIDEYRCVSQDWRVSANFHEFAFGLAYKDAHFYATLATAIEPGGASTNPQIPDRGKVAKISKATGKVEFIAHGLRTPNGIGEGVDGELFVADNQGDWLPSCKILHVKENAWYGSRSVDYAGTESITATLPVVWLPQNEIGNSPSQPIYLNDGPYKGQMMHGEVTHGGLKRVFTEKINGNYQGCVFRFTQGLEAGVNRVAWGPDNALYIGGIGSSGNWQHSAEGKLWHGLQRMKFKEATAFEMLAVRAKSNGFEIEFTQALQSGDGGQTTDYLVKQWYYQPTAEYGGPKMDEQTLPLQSVHVSDDRKKVFLEIPNLKAEHVVYLRLRTPFVSENGQELWSTEAWYTLNAIPENEQGFTSNPVTPPPHNTLSEAEKAAGWQLLFDGKSTDGWRNYGKQSIGKSWKVAEGALMLERGIGDDGSSKVLDGGDIITTEQFQNFELKLEWKIQACGNSGIFYNVVESPEHDAVWRTGPEMQILDNVCHPDAKYATHRAGDLYDLLACQYETVKPAGSWNQVRIISNKGRVEHWLNGRKLVDFELFTPEWETMIAQSKFKDMPAFGLAKKGHLALQDHGDEVWFRNLKVRRIE